MVHKTLETVSETDALREDLHKTQRKICKEAEVLPQGLEIPHGALSISEPLGSGGSCTVYKAVLAGKAVAAKRLSERYGIDTCKVMGCVPTNNLY